MDTYGYLYCEDLNSIKYDDDSGGNGQFEL